MDQKNENLKEVNDSSNAEEKSGLEKRKKVLLILFFVIVFGGTYYCTSVLNTNKSEISNAPVTSTMQIQPDKSDKKLNSATVISDKKEDVAKVTAVQAAKQKKKVIVTRIPKFIQPTAKQSLIRLAMASRGKVDPFVGLHPQVPEASGSDISKITELPKMNKNLPVKFGDLPQPQFLKNLPGLRNLPGMEKMNTFNNYDSIEIKGFIGNKVIVSMNGVTDSLKANESFQGIKVLSVDKNNLKAKFSNNGDIVTKSIKSLTYIQNKEDVQLVKNNNK